MTESPAETIDDQATKAPQPAPALRLRYRIRFSKHGLLRWTSHRDLARLWERLVRRAQLKLSMTEGFHPKPRIAFPSALALGVDGLDEVVELELAERLAVGELLDRLSSDNQPGLTIKSVKLLPDRFGKAQLACSDYIITIPDSVDVSDLQPRIETLMSTESVEIERKKKTHSFKISEHIKQLERENTQLRLSLYASDGASLRPGDILDLIGASDWVENGARISRTKVILQKEFETTDPDSIATATDPGAAATTVGAATPKNKTKGTVVP